MENLLEELVDLEINKKIEFNNKTCEERMQYNGTFDETLKKVKKSLNEEDPYELYLNVNRLMIGFLDYCIDTKQNPLEEKNNLRTCIQEIYSGNLKKSSEILNSLKFPRELGKTICEEKKDYISWSAFSPLRNYQLIEKIDGNFSPDLVVMDGHDGYRPGFSVANHFNADVLPIRCSLDSKRDSGPNLLWKEGKELRESYSDKNILIVGEDTSTGKTITTLKDLIRRNCPGANIKSAATIFIPDINDYTIVDYFGERKTVFS